MLNFLYRKDVKKYYYFVEYLYFVLGIDYEYIYLKIMLRLCSFLFIYWIFCIIIFFDVFCLKNGLGSDLLSRSSSFFDVRNRGKWLFWRFCRFKGIVFLVVDIVCNWLLFNEFFILENVFWILLYKIKFFVMKSCWKEFFLILLCVNLFFIKCFLVFLFVKKIFYSIIFIKI